MNPLVLLLASFFLLILLRVNIGFALLLSSVAVLYYEDLPFASAVNQMYANIDSFPLMAVPFFMFLGRLLNSGGITERLLAVADVTVGHIRGGLGHVNVFISMVFASLSGSAAADTASVGAILIPAMKKAGYDPIKMVKLGESFFTSLGLDPLPATFWERSMFTKPDGREVVAEGKALGETVEMGLSLYCEDKGVTG